MDADWAVELGGDDPVLEFPWSSPDAALFYVDLKQHVDRLGEIAEAALYPELAEFLLAINAPESPWLTAKCDVWCEENANSHDAVFAGATKFCSYVDLLSADESWRSSFQRHEQFVKSAARALSEGDADEHISSELIVRRCWFHRANSASDPQAALPADPEEGFYVTIYVFGYGSDPAEARSHWAGGLKHVTTILTSLRANLR